MAEPTAKALKMSLLYNLSQGDTMKYGLVPHPALPLGDQISSNKTWKHHILNTQSSAMYLLYSAATNCLFPYLIFLLYMETT